MQWELEQQLQPRVLVLYPCKGSLLAAPLLPGLILHLPAGAVSLQPKSDHSHSGTSGRGRSGQLW